MIQSFECSRATLSRLTVFICIAVITVYLNLEYRKKHFQCIY